MTNLETEVELMSLTNVLEGVREIIDSDLYNSLPVKEKLLLKYYQLFAISEMGEFDAPKDINEILHEFEEISEQAVMEKESLQVKILYKAVKMQILFFKNKIEEGLALKKEFQNLIEQNDPEEKNEEYWKYLGLFYYNIFDIYKNELEKAKEQLEVVEKCKENWSHLTNDFYDYLAYTLETWYYLQLPDYDKTLELNRQKLNYYKEKKFSTIFSFKPYVELSNGLIFTARHDLKGALKYSDEVMELIEKLHPLTELEYLLDLKTYIFNIRGIIYDLVGDYRKSIQLRKEALRISDSLMKLYGKMYNRQVLLANLGETYGDIGEYEKGLELINGVMEKTSMAYSGPLNHMWYNEDLRTSEGNFILINIYLKMNNLDKVRECIENIKRIKDKPNLNFHEKNLIQAEYKISTALLLLKKKNFIDIGKAKSLLQEAIVTPTKLELICDAIIPLVEIILLEYRAFQNESILEEFNELSKKITEIVEKHNSVELNIRLLVLQGKIAFIHNEIEKTEQFNYKALELAKEFERKDLIKKTTEEIELVQKKNGSSTEGEVKSMTQRFIDIELENYLQDAFKIIKGP